MIARLYEGDIEKGSVYHKILKEYVLGEGSENSHPGSFIVSVYLFYTISCYTCIDVRSFCHYTSVAQVCPIFLSRIRYYQRESLLSDSLYILV